MSALDPHHVDDDVLAGIDLLSRDIPETLLDGCSLCDPNLIQQRVKEEWDVDNKGVRAFRGVVEDAQGMYRHLRGRDVEIWRDANERIIDVIVFD